MKFCSKPVWWYWALTTGLLVGVLAGFSQCLQAVIALNIVQVVYFVIRDEFGEAGNPAAYAAPIATGDPSCRGARCRGRIAGEAATDSRKTIGGSVSGYAIMHFVFSSKTYRFNAWATAPIGAYLAGFTELYAYEPLIGKNAKAQTSELSDRWTQSYWQRVAMELTGKVTVVTGCPRALAVQQ